MNTLKLTFKLADNKERSITLKNVKQDAAQVDVKALGNYIATNAMLIFDGVKATSFVKAVLENSNQTVINA